MKKTWVAFLFAVACTSVAQASVTTYTDRTTWNTAVPVSSTQTFESFAADTSFATVPLNVGAFTLAAVGTAEAGTDLVDVSPFINAASPAALFGNAFVTIFVQDPLAADLIFATPQNAFFADFYAAGNGSQLDLTLSFEGGGTADILVPGTGSSQQSFGFISTTAVTSIRFNNSSNDGFFIDNISVPSAAVPEPASAGLLLAGIVGLGWRRRRQA